MQKILQNLPQQQKRKKRCTAAGIHTYAQPERCCMLKSIFCGGLQLEIPSIPYHLILNYSNPLRENFIAIARIMLQSFSCRKGKG